MWKVGKSPPMSRVIINIHKHLHIHSVKPAPNFIPKLWGEGATPRNYSGSSGATEQKKALQTGAAKQQVQIAKLDFAKLGMLDMIDKSTDSALGPSNAPANKHLTGHVASPAATAAKNSPGDKKVYTPPAQWQAHRTHVHSPLPSKSEPESHGSHRQAAATPTSSKVSQQQKKNIQHTSKGRRKGKK
jgi:hypothetical protein